VSAHLVATGSNSGTGATVTATSTNPIPSGAVFAFYCSAAVSAKTFTLTDNSGLGNVYTILQFTDAVVGESGILAVAKANSIIPTGTVWTATISSGTPGGRMAGVAYWDDTFRAPVPTSDVATIRAQTGTTSGILSYTPTDTPELVIFACMMRSSTAGGINDSITLDGTLVQVDNRNHPGTVTAYQALGYRSLPNANPTNDSATFLASDSTITGAISVKLPVPPPPGGGKGNLLILKLT
jgi:hypothetical protein